MDLQTTFRWETDPSKQLGEPYVSPEANAVLQGTRLLIQLIVEHPLETFFVGAGVAWLVYLANSRN